MPQRQTAPRYPTCAITGKRIHDSREGAEVRIALMRRLGARKGQPPYRGEAYPCGDHWHVGRRETGYCRHCRAHLGRTDHKLTCPRRGGA